MISRLKDNKYVYPLNPGIHRASALLFDRHHVSGQKFSTLRPKKVQVSGQQSAAEGGIHAIKYRFKRFIIFILSPALYLQTHSFYSNFHKESKGSVL